MGSKERERKDWRGRKEEVMQLEHGDEGKVRKDRKEKGDLGRST